MEAARGLGGMIGAGIAAAIAAGVVYFREHAKPKAPPVPIQLIGGYSSQNDMRLMLEALKRIEAFQEIGNKLADEAEDTNRHGMAEIARAMRDNTASIERTAAAAAAALLRTADETRRLGDTMGQAMAAMTKGAKHD